MNYIVLVVDGGLIKLACVRVQGVCFTVKED